MRHATSFSRKVLHDSKYFQDTACHIYSMKSIGVCLYLANQISDSLLINTKWCFRFGAQMCSLSLSDIHLESIEKLSTTVR